MTTYRIDESNKHQQSFEKGLEQCLLLMGKFKCTSHEFTGNLLFLHFRLHQLQRKHPIPKLSNGGIGTLIFLNSGSVCFGEIIIIHSSRGVEGIHVMSYRDLQCWTTHLSSPYRACLPCSCPC